MIYKNIIAKCLIYITTSGSVFAQSGLNHIPAKNEISVADRFDNIVNRPYIKEGGIGKGGATPAIVLLTFTEQCRSAEGIRISASGEQDWFLISGGGVSFGGMKTGSRPKLSKEEVASIEKLAISIPASPPALPPLERRMVFMHQKDGRWTTTVFDRANLPSSVLQAVEVLGWIEPRMFGRWVIRHPFSKSAKIGSDLPLTISRFLVSPDGRAFVWCQSGDDVRVYDTDSWEIKQRLPSVGKWGLGGCKFSPNGRFFLVMGADNDKIHVFETLNWTRIGKFRPPTTMGKAGRFQITPDSKFVWVWTPSQIVTFRTSDWTKQEPQEWFPKKTRWCELSGDGRRAVVFLDNHSVWLWDVNLNRQIVELGKSCNLLKASFSPDRKFVAVLTSARDHKPDQMGELRLRVFDSESGTRIVEFQPYGLKWNVPFYDYHLLWSPDGNYLLGTGRISKSTEVRCIHVWSVKARVHYADFFGPSSKVTGIGFTHTNKLIGGTENGHVFEWNYKECLKAIQDLEESFSVKEE